MTKITIKESIKEIKEMADTMTALGDLQKAEALNHAAKNMEQLLVSLNLWLYNKNTCRSCAAPIVWIRTKNGKSMPCDAKPLPFKYGGNTKLVTPFGEVVSCEVVKFKYSDKVEGYGYTPHWSTCNAPDSFRKAGHQPTTSVTTQPPNVGSGVQPPKKDEKRG